MERFSQFSIIWVLVLLNLATENNKVRKDNEGVQKTFFGHYLRGKVR